MNASRKKAAEQWSKLMRLSRENSNRHEAESARLAASKLVTEHGLSLNELQAEIMSCAFDELVESLHKIVKNHPHHALQIFDTKSIVDSVLDSIKHMDVSDKAAKLRQITMVVRTASFIAGDNKTIREVKTTLDTILKNHEITL